MNLDELYQKKDVFTGGISAQLRAINLGILGLAWLLILRVEDVAAIAGKISQKALLLIALGCVMSMLLDLLQYLFAEYEVKRDIAIAEGRAKSKVAPDKLTFAYRAHSWSYRGKLYLTVTSAGATIVVIALACLV